MKKILFTLAVLLSGTMLHADDVKYLSRKELEQCNIILTYPQWKLKALSFSYDDGNIADRKLIEIFNRFGMHGTFHIPSAWLTDPKRSVSRVKEAEIKTLYSGHEVSGHGAKHVTLTLVKPARIAGELDGDITTWQRITGKKLIGYAYPFGRYNDTVVNILKEKGLIYARICKPAKSFDLTEDFLRWRPHAHHNRNIMKLGNAYLKFVPQRLSLLLIWGHSYEFNKHNNWDRIENFCKLMANKPDIFYATMGDIALYAGAAAKLALTADGKSIQNHSDRPVFLIYKGEKIELAPGKTLCLK